MLVLAIIKLLGVIMLEMTIMIGLMLELYVLIAVGHTQYMLQILIMMAIWIFLLQLEMKIKFIGL